MPPDHRLARKKRVKESDLVDEQVLLLEDGHCLRDQTLPFCESAGACELADFRATSLMTLVQMVAAGIGITLLPRLAIQVESRMEKQLKIRPFARPVPFRTIGLAWRRSSPHGEHYRRLAEILQGLAPGTE
jgi:LysR family hydrogen peroxide-inducible transcriptional activator